MLVFLDDSGDPGFKVSKGSSPCFVIAMVIFDDPLEAERCAVAIKELRRDLGLDDAYEFRFSKCNREFRLAFLKCVSKFSFRIRAIIMDKSIIYSTVLRESKESFYSYTIKLVLQHSFQRIQDARLKLDGHGDRTFRRELQSYLRRELKGKPGEKPIFSALRFENSRQNVLVQLADMVAGALRRHAEGKKDDHQQYRGAIEKRIEDAWRFGKCDGKD